VKDRAFAGGNDSRTVSSIAATGFGLTALCIADQRGYMAGASIVARVQATLSFLLNQMPNRNGFFYHFVDRNTGQRVNNSEVSSIDTAILLCGVLTCRQHFQDQQIVDLAAQIHQRINWPWMLNGGSTFSTGWTPESGFLIDGSIVPCATSGSIPFLSSDCVAVLRNIQSAFPKAWQRYSFVDAFNPLTGWYDTDVLGIDLGITMLMAENQRTGFVSDTFMKNPEVVGAMTAVGFH
jgi:hypothetical protein